MSNNELTHYGIMGMRWGVRRSSSSSSGGSGKGTSDKPKKKIAKDMSDEDLASSVKRMNLEKQYTKLSKENKPTSQAERAKKVVDATSSLVNQAKNISSKPAAKEKLDLSKITDQQLRERINRTILERQYNDMFAPPATVAKGKRYVSNVLEVAGTTLAIGSSALGIALAIKELRG